MKVVTGLDVLINDINLQNKFKGAVALLSHNASVDASFTHAAVRFKELFADRFVKMFGPQHGFATDVQDNMVETDHYIHPYFNIPVYSLYSETRIPTDEMLKGIDHLFIDLQDVGCRVYTYIWTLTLILDKCVGKNIEIVILDRPNPINGVDIEGNVLEPEFVSFVGLHKLPMRHGMTIGEVALMHQKYWAKERVKLQIIKMQGWEREMYFKDTKLPWILPSPNLARAESTCTFPATVLFEGAMISEGRGTSQPLEIFGHPMLDPFSFYDKKLKTSVKESKLKGFALRPITFLPTFQKFENQVCGGYQIHITNKKTFKPWRVGQFLMKELYHHLGDKFEWKSTPYEYNFNQNPFDIINGTDKIRHWIENNEPIEKLDIFENHSDYKIQFEDIKIY